MNEEELKLEYWARKLITAVEKIQRCKVTELDSETKKHLHDLYGTIWCEACYDPMNGSTQDFAKKLLKPIQRLNEIWKFKT